MPLSTTSAKPLQISVPAGQSTLICMPPGSTLRTVCGRLSLHMGPLVLGQVIASRHPLAYLGAEQEWQLSGTSTSQWLCVRNRGDKPAEALLIEAVHSAWQLTAWHAVRQWTSLRWSELKGAGGRRLTPTGNR